MEIKRVEAKPYEDSIPPGIIFDVEISYTKLIETIISVKGWLKTDDGKIIAAIHELPARNIPKGEIGAKNTSYDDKIKGEIYKTIIIAPLSKEAIKYLEERRMIDKKGDVYLTLDLNITCLRSKAVIWPSFIIEVQKLPRQLKDMLENIKVSTSTGTRPIEGIVTYTYDQRFTPDRTNQWIISGDGSPVFIDVYEYKLEARVRIPATDWIHDYAPKLGLGEYIILEIPHDGKIKEAWNLVEKAEECFRRWDIKGVYSNCREVGYLLDRLLKDKLGKDSFDYKERWGRAYGKFEHMASLALHEQDLKNRYKDVKIEKADAEYLLFHTKLLIKYAEELLNNKN